jgi:hypothetical protein
MVSAGYSSPDWKTQETRDALEIFSTDTAYDFNRCKEAQRRSGGIAKVLFASPLIGAYSLGRVS